MIKLYIKGTVEESEAAIKEWEFTGFNYLGEFNFVDHTATTERDPEYYLHVLAWFHEKPPLIPGYGYPAGTLLFFSLIENATDSDGYN